MIGRDTQKMTPADLARELKVPVSDVYKMAKQRGLQASSGNDALSVVQADAIRRDYARQDVSTKSPSQRAATVRSTATASVPPARPSQGGISETGQWLRIDLPVFDPQGFANSLRAFVAGHADGLLYFLEIDEGTGRLRSMAWIKPPTRGKREEENNYGESTTRLMRTLSKDFLVSLSTMSRLLEGSAVHVSWGTVHRLGSRFEALDPTAWQRARKQLLAPRVWRELEQYIAYINRERKRLNAYRKAKHSLYFESDEQRERDELFQTARNLGLPASRADLGIYRVVDVLVGWRPMRQQVSPADRAALFRAGVTREKGLMRAEAGALRATLYASSKRARLK